MTSTSLSHAVDTWTAKSAVASRYLLGLYRVLGDDKQAANAMQAGKSSEERARRLGLDIQMAAMKTLHGEIDPENMLAEARAWGILVEAYAGICAFHAMVDSQAGQGRSLQGARNTANKALERSIHGFRMAFPEEMAREGIQRAIEAAACICAKTFVDDLTGEDLDLKREALEKSVYQDILNALGAESLVHSVS